jgi:hypothetical protein
MEFIHPEYIRICKDLGLKQSRTVLLPEHVRKDFIGLYIELIAVPRLI